jgi:hypothetical protein
MADYKLSIKLTDEVEKKFSRNLQNKELINQIIISSEGNKRIFEDLLFTSKYLMGLFRSVTSPEYQPNEILNKEMEDNVEKVKDILKFLLKEGYGEFKEKFFTNTDETLIMMVLFFAELEFLKYHINDLKREG